MFPSFLVLQVISFRSEKLYLPVFSEQVCWRHVHSSCCILSIWWVQKWGEHASSIFPYTWDSGPTFLISGLMVFPSPNFRNASFEELQKWRCPDYYEDNVHKMQLPFSSKLLGSTLTSEEKQERRQQQLRRLQELNARRREEKLQLDQERLDRLLYVQVMRTPGWVPAVFFL